ncbi:hypothetical protein [Halalkalicoccus salilacus]|uniref:hypothetical protein n=1 Tax=Halalkalicoccus TaxID=332246 RepID=UPI002F964AA9
MKRFSRWPLAFHGHRSVVSGTIRALTGLSIGDGSGTEPLPGSESEGESGDDGEAEDGDESEEPPF